MYLKARGMSRMEKKEQLTYVTKKGFEYVSSANMSCQTLETVGRLDDLTHAGKKIRSSPQDYCDEKKYDPQGMSC